MRKYEVGDMFDRLTILEVVSDPKNPRAICVCLCGALCAPQLGALGNGRATSCGCRRREILAVANVKHGMSNSREYKAYHAIVQRCTNPEDASFANYGGRGIRCLWKSFERFYKDMGTRPRGCWIERKDNDGHYSKSNCEWTSAYRQSINKRGSKLWIVEGKTYESQREAATALGLDMSTVHRRCCGYKRGGQTHPPRAGWSFTMKYDPEQWG